MAVSAPPKPFVPAVCHLCGRILDDDPDVVAPLNGNDFVAPAAASDPDVCIHCERLLSTEPALSSDWTNPLALLPAEVTRTPSQRLKPGSLIVVDSRREVRLPSTSLVYVGRRDETQNIYPHIDLTHDDAVIYGVSRRHACIHQTDSGTYVEDLDSTNGTYVNSQRLTPFKLYPLEHGDMLHLGKFKLVVTFSAEQ
jgi:pSer/pThr/pTyr-binding forkhead associated (FHA) protein